MSRFFLCSLLVISVASWSEEPIPSAHDVMRMVEDRYDGESSDVRSVLVLVNSRGDKRARDIRQLSLEKKEVNKSLIYFESPSSIKGATYLNHDWKPSGGSDDSWLFLPALKKINRVSSSKKSESFMGSDFSYADLDGLEFDDFSYIFALDFEGNNNDVWVVDALPKDSEVVRRTGYKKVRWWISKEYLLPIKAIFDQQRKGSKKYLTAKDIRLIDRIWTPHQLQMVSVKNGKIRHSSVIRIETVAYDIDLDESEFNRDAMLVER